MSLEENLVTVAEKAAEIKTACDNTSDAINAKLGTTDKVNAQDFADKVNEVYDKGQLKQAHTILGRSFPNTYYIPHGCTILSIYTFSYCWGNDFEIVIPDTVTQMHNSVFQYCYCLGKVNVPPNLTVFGVTMFHTCEQLKTIVFNNVKEFMVMDSGKTYNCKVLKDVIVENGVIAQNWAFSHSPLTVESMKSIITHLKNFSGTGSEGTTTLTFTSACWELLEASTSPYEDGLTDNESLTWRDYIEEELGWLTA